MPRLKLGKLHLPHCDNESFYKPYLVYADFFVPKLLSEQKHNQCCMAIELT